MFPETHWTLVLAAGQTMESEGQRALESLCQAYWYPVYGYIRNSGYSADDAQDLTQEFFLELLDGVFLQQVDRGRGRFRTFLLGAVKFFLSDQHRRRNAQKRGGGKEIIPFGISGGEATLSREPAHTDTPERIFERRWANTVLHRALQHLRQEFAAHGRADYFDEVKVYLAGQAELPYADMARRLNLSEGALKAGIHRLRKRYQQTLRAEVASMVSDDAEVEAEIRYLAATLRS